MIPARTRKTLLLRETTTADTLGLPCAPVTCVAALAVVRNPLAGRAEADLSALFAIGAAMGAELAAQAAALLSGPPVSDGKAAIVGAGGAMEHGGAVIHTRLGKPMRAAAGGGEAVIPSNVRLGALEASIDLPLGRKDDPWSFGHSDTMTLGVPDAARPDEIVRCLAYADGGRPWPRCGKGPVAP